MGMTIDEAINHLGNYSSTNGSGLTTDEQHNEAKRVSIDTMRKYEKILDIIHCYNRYTDDAAECIDKLRGIIKDGR